MEIMKLKPAGKDYFWGGLKLKEEFGKSLDMTPLAETWECSVHPDGCSIVASGEFKGMTLSAVLEKNPQFLGTKCKEKKELPVLVKFIDAKQDLSIQVHPDDYYARKYEEQNGKSEMWYIIEAADDANIIYGFEHPVDKKILQEAVSTGELDKHVQKIPVKKDDVYFVPAGTIHGIGAGVLLVEVQENSNVTYRVYDYDRVDKNGEKRELQFDKAVDVLNMDIAPEIIQKNRLVHYYPGCSREVLCRCEYFETEKIRVTCDFSFSVKEESFQIILCLSGEGKVECTDCNLTQVDFHKGDCLFIPADMGRCQVVGETELLKIRC